MAHVYLFHKSRVNKWKYFNLDLILVNTLSMAISKSEISLEVEMLPRIGIDAAPAIS